MLAVCAASPVLAQDSDGDGVADSADAYPCDASYAGVAYAPAQGAAGLLLIEDQWPDRGDLDFNDAVISYGYEYLRDGAGRVVRLNAELAVHALGGDFDNGLALGLPVPRGDVAAVTRDFAGVTTSLSPSSVDANLVVPVVDDIRAFLNLGSGPAFGLSGAPIRISIDFATPAVLPMSEAPHDLHLFRVGQPGLQVHRIGYGGTATVDSSLFGFQADRSQPGRWYVDYSGIPFVLEVPANVHHPHEGVAISQLYPDIVTFGQSGGAQATDFYVSQVDTSVGSLVAPSAPPSTAADTSCAVAPGEAAGVAGPSCQALLAAGQTSSGIYWVDPDGAGGLAPYEAYCDQSTQGGGWMLVIANRRESAGTVAIDTVVTPNYTQRVLNDARWGYLRDRATEAMATFGSTRIVARMAQLRAANCQPLAYSLTAPMLAHAENSGCTGTGTDYSLWFGYRNSWSRANAIYDYSRWDFYSSGGAFNPDPASMWVR